MIRRGHFDFGSTTQTLQSAFPTSRSMYWGTTSQNHESANAFQCGTVRAASSGHHVRNRHVNWQVRSAECGAAFAGAGRDVRERGLAARKPPLDDVIDPYLSFVRIESSRSKSETRTINPPHHSVLYGQAVV